VRPPPAIASTNVEATTSAARDRSAVAKRSCGYWAAGDEEGTPKRSWVQVSPVEEFVSYSREREA
jgi:hypothetical protein